MHHRAEWCMKRHHMTLQHLLLVLQGCQQMPGTCLARDPNAPTTPWPVFHLIARHQTDSSTTVPPQAYRWVVPWFYSTHTSPPVACDTESEPHWLLTTTPTWPLPQPHRNRHPLQHVQSRENRQLETPLLCTLRLLPHAGTPDTHTHVPKLDQDTAHILD